MARKKYKPAVGDLVLVDWVDAFSSSTWKDITDFTDKYLYQGSLVKGHVGYIVKYNRMGLVISASLDLKEKEVGGAWFIPRRMIQSIRKIDLK